MSNYIFIVSAPSGAGKSSLLKAFLATKVGKENFTIATSHTTREPRTDEVNGREYHFVTIAEFEQMLNQDGFIEYAKVFKNYYGTSKAEIDSLLAANKNIILEIDWQGAQQTRAIYGDRAKSIFILPPSLDELRKRLEKRNTDSKETIDYRMEQAETEISHATEYDCQLVNDDFSQSLEQLCQYFAKNIQS
ncbi:MULTISPECIES: guanylate kinase [Francisella]|uniref:Guanylate kinase n=1 Tax=Francisella opportunistica TaxID=2016517 RepID=A0A345JRJ9_9GAMM|nr:MULTISPECIES: guanylate kinase [Francisella]APC91678.1 Guanylate kinase [Francisella sp. MA067296]AXH29945.1 guanylate kinase [Francisella opportunistica]AXH31592.1 guanylate kinase [Francisella opportunistica]AXH33240.1 guanylate kinase [Francisella opportunistica]